MTRKRSPRQDRTSKVHSDNDLRKDETGYATSYVEFAKTLRTWFVAYGIGAPVLVLSQDSLRAKLGMNSTARMLAVEFLGGVALQIIAALTYKIAMWYLYIGELDSGFRTTHRYRWSDRISVALWLELLFDFGTLSLFGWATLQMLKIFVA